jgi:hypothetical protein
MRGVVRVEILDGPPDMIMTIVAPERQKAAEYLMDILDSLDGITEDLHVLPVRRYTERNLHRNHLTGQKINKLKVRG